jgi:hypothetical protein
MMKRLLTLTMILGLLLPSGLMMFGGAAKAAVNNNNLVDDYTFDNIGTMSATQINNWLNTLPGSCISPNSGFAASDPLGYTPNYPHVDGKYLYGSAVSAGQVIYDAAVGHGLNPQVLLTKLQNEEQLVDGSAGCGSTWRYASAVGYACTDSDTFSHNYSYTGADPFSDSSALPTPIYYRNGTPINSITGSCVNTNVYAGFPEQVVHAAWALSIWRHKSEGLVNWAAINGGWNHCDDINACPPSMNIPSGWSCYSGLMTQGTLKRCTTDSTGTFYDGYASIDGQALHMDNGSTAALYVYTPHIQSFTTIFSQFFGDPHSPCIATSNVSGALSGSKVVAYQNQPGPTKMALLQMNNTGSECMETHIWNSGYQSWFTHIATAMKASDPSIGTLLPMRSPGSSTDGLVYVLYNGSEGSVEVHKLSPDLKIFPGYYDVATNLSAVNAASGTFVAGDFLGRGYDQLAYVLYSGAGGKVEVHLFDPSLQKAVGYYDVATNLGGVTATTGRFVAADFLGRGYDQLAYVLYDGSTGKTEVHLFDQTLRKGVGYYDVATNLSGVSANTGTFTGGDFLGRGYSQLAYVAYDGTSSGKVEVHTFSRDLRQAVGFQDIATNLPSFDPTQ